MVAQSTRRSANHHPATDDGASLPIAAAAARETGAGWCVCDTLIVFPCLARSLPLSLAPSSLPSPIPSPRHSLYRLCSVHGRPVECITDRPNASSTVIAPTDACAASSSVWPFVVIFHDFAPDRAQDFSSFFSRRSRTVVPSFPAVTNIFHLIVYPLSSSGFIRPRQKSASKNGFQLEY